jgi:hypothetical protein
MMRVRSAGVVRRQRRRTALRRTSADPTATAQERAVSTGEMPPTGAAWRKRVSAPVPVNAQRKMLCTSSAVT